MRSLFVLLPLLVLLVAACEDRAPASGSDATTTQPLEETIPFRIDGTLDILREGEPLLTLDIEIADTDSTRQRGMMQRDAFPPNTGMLFLFDDIQIRRFWMTNTPLSLDLLFIGPDSQLVDVAKYATPFSDDPIPSAAPAQFVLEVPAGFVDTHGLIEGDQLRWRRN